MKNQIIITILCMMLAVGCSHKNEKSDSDIALVNEKDVAMNRAIEMAQNSFPSFLQRFANPQSGDSNFVVKVKIVDSTGVEHLWVSNLVVNDSGFSGIVGNEPEFVTSVQFNGPISFKKADITDWAYTDSNGVRQGSFTVKVLLHRMSSEDAANYRSVFGWDDTVGNGFVKDSTQ